MGLLVAIVSDDECEAAGSSGSICGGGAGNGPGVSCARTTRGALNTPAAKTQTKPAVIVSLFLIIILTHAQSFDRACTRARL